MGGKDGEGGRDPGADAMKCVPSSPGQAEVQAVFSDGAVSLHTRSLKYGKVTWALAVPVCRPRLQGLFLNPRRSLEF